MGPEKPSPDSLAELAGLWESDRALTRKTGTELRTGVDPELLSTGIQIAVLYIEAGDRTFAQFAAAMLQRMGGAVRPYLKGIYVGASMMPGAPQDVDSQDTVKAFDLATLDDEGTSTRNQLPRVNVKYSGESGTTSRGPRKSSPSSLAAWERAMKVASRMKPDEETFPGKAPKPFPVGRLRKAMREAGTVAKE